MTSSRRSPPLPTTIVPPRPLTGSEWFVARATLALRRSGRFARGWTLSVGGIALIALLIPFASGDPNAAEKSRLERQAADTLQSAQRLRRAEAAMAVAESTLVAARAQQEPPRRAVVTPRPTPPVTRATDPNATSLDLAIQEARRLRTVASWMTVAEHPAVESGPRMRGLAASLTALSLRRDALVSGPERDQRVADLTQRIGRVGYTILAIADNRRSELMAAGVELAVSPVPGAQAPIVTAENAIARPDTAALLAARTVARDTLAASRGRHDSLVLAVRSAGTALAGHGRSRIALASPAIVLALVLLVGLLARVASALSQEMNAPTLAHAHEAERVSGAPVLATVRDAMLDGPARFRPSGVDPFRMLYLSLTATGTRARTAIVTGSDPLIAAATGARLAIAAAADHRTTLIVDLDPAGIGLARVFRERAEPGLTDALAGGFKWRELARPVGSSDGLPITLLPAGTERDDLPSGDAFVEVRDEFSKFRAGYELTIFVTPREQLELAAALLGSSPLILTALAGVTLVARFAEESESIRSAGLRLQGTVLWDAPKPNVPSRAELAALLSKRKGRTPGGSFEAVNKAIRNKQT